MSFIPKNLNPQNKRVGDCVIRAVSAVLAQDWDKTFWDICKKGFEMADMPSSDAVWGAYLWDKGYRRETLPNTCPECYTVRDFCRDHPHGRYVLHISGGDAGHVVAIIYGDYIDTWDSGDSSPGYYWRR